MGFLDRLRRKRPSNDKVRAQEEVSERGAPSSDALAGAEVQPSAGPQEVEKASSVMRVGRASDIGQVRTTNQDALVTFVAEYIGDHVDDAGMLSRGPFGFFIVADGMGGHQAGEVASSLAARVVAHQVIETIYLPYLMGEGPEAFQDPLTDLLGRAVSTANQAVHQQVPGGGTTLTCALVLGRRVYVAHVGDSRAYLVTDRLRQLTQDHSFVGRLVELGELSPDEAAVHPQRNVLYRAVGQGDHLDVDTYSQLLPPASRLLLCSDGLWGHVSEEEIGAIIASTPNPQKACERLIEAANAAGGSDNITVVLIEIPD